ncbi:MAG: 16S rRNA (cytosine(1402)-N(4))-methyltransferase RsmH [Candidatus Neomarinimicrobiota bacterium]
MEATPKHIPVMVSEVVSYMGIQPKGVYCDCTIGLGGHSRIILNELSQDGRLIGIDVDEEMLSLCQSEWDPFPPNLTLYHESYNNINHILRDQNIKSVDGILLDLGLSSIHLDESKRGFSYRREEPLDMRFSSKFSMSASDIIANSSVEQLANIIYQFGEEWKSRKIARAIKVSKVMNSVGDLRGAVASVTPPHALDRTLARVFQSIRIAVNNELEQLSDFLEIFIDVLSTGGRIVVISFHSLEDRLVKNSFRQYRINGHLEILTKKPIRPTVDETSINRRSKSARLRAAMKV